MSQNYKNSEDLNSLSLKELEDYYRCYSHHHFNRNQCKIEPKENKSMSFLCNFKSENHFCNCEAKARDEKNSPNDSIYLCEYTRPSYTSKEDQINDVQKMIRNMKKSKFLLKQAMKDVDSLIEEKKPDSDGLDEVQRFYRSNKFIGSSITINSYKDMLPRTDIKSGKYVYELCALDDIPIRGNAIFSIKKNPKISSSLTVVACKHK
ncbi:hypothetical protein BpHYR1_052559 [Brachionus plicatilis]|uniref:Uncharacterized protein n=1 Tax=Brachionus plicatilis TaxID=10195 RepID=A0A3M7P4Y1_BRAPC|nr:hypothetical protein BpHYR1_052559 [Brachionus plicatilis]